MCRSVWAESLWIKISSSHYRSLWIISYCKRKRSRVLPGWVCARNGNPDWDRIRVPGCTSPLLLATWCQTNANLAIFIGNPYWKTAISLNKGYQFFTSWLHLATWKCCSIWLPCLSNTWPIILKKALKPLSKPRPLPINELQFPHLYISGIKMNLAYSYCHYHVFPNTPSLTPPFLTPPSLTSPPPDTKAENNDFLLWTRWLLHITS